MPREASLDDEAFVAYGTALVVAVDAAIEGWVVRCVEQLLIAWRGATDAESKAAAERAGAAARDEIVGELRALLALDIDEQRGNPLAVLRAAVRFPTAVLRDVGVPEVVRDEFAVRAFPDDVYDLAPASFADVDPSLHEPGLEWGAAKAHIHLSRRRADGMR